MRKWATGDGGEVVWTAALALVFMTVGYTLLPTLIRMAGKSGRIESVEWALFLLMGSAFPVAAAASSWILVRFAGRRASIADVIAWAIISILAVRFFVIHGIAPFLASTASALAVLAIVLRARKDSIAGMTPAWFAAVILAATAVWEGAFRLVNWTDAGTWLVQSVRTPILLALVLVAATFTVIPRRNDEGDSMDWSPRLRWLDLLAFVVFAALSFRTTPVVEFYHWSFWVGPIESARQGGWFLWDVPSQYGFLSLLLPSLLPLRDSWQSLYMFQAALYLVNAGIIYVLIAGLSTGLIPRVFALAFTATTLFFRPRIATMILPAQMTPAGGPMRFFWCYGILAVLYWKYRRSASVSDKQFIVVGTAVWIAGVAWSVESAIYTSAAWGGAYVVFLLQRYFARRDDSGMRRARRLRKLAAGIAIPFASIVMVTVAVSAFYMIVDGHPPDWQSYYEYAVLFSAGYSSLPVEVTDDIWYLVALFIVVSAVVVRLIARDPSHPGLIPAVGAWGTAWAISSYFVSRSHPVNLLSLVPLLVFSLVIVLHLLRSTPLDKWSRILPILAVPLVAMPTVLTLAHGDFPALLFHRQDPVSKLTVQVPAMDSSLAHLATTAGMRPSDPVFFVGDGRYLMPRWPELEQGRARTNPLGWQPKPYEMISTLSESRRNSYVTRFQSRIGRGGWLVQKKTDINAGYLSLVALIEKSYTPIQKFENDQWLAVRYEPRRPATD